MKNKLLILLVTILVVCSNITAQSNSLSVDIRLQFVTAKTFKLTFSEDVNVTEASNIANYEISGTGGIIGNPVLATVVNNEVVLELGSDITQLGPNESVEVKVTNVTSLAGIAIDVNKNVAKYFVWHFWETVDNSGLTGSYTSNSYTGSHGVVWRYENCAGTATYDNGILLRYSDRAYSKASFITTSAIDNGVGKISFNYYKIWSNNDVRSFELTVKDANDDVYSYQENDFVVSGSPSANELFESVEINKKGIVELKIENISKTNQNIVVDNIQWTSYAPAMPVKLYAIEQDKLIVEFNQLIEPSSVIKQNFELSVAGSNLEILDVIYQHGNIAMITFNGNLDLANDGDMVKLGVSGVVNAINGLETIDADVSFAIDKPKVVSKLEYVDNTTFKVVFTKAVDPTLASQPENYILSGTGGTTGHPIHVIMESATVAVLTVPSTADYDDGMTLEVTVDNVTGAEGIFTMAAPDNKASVIIDRTAPEVLSQLEFIDMETVVLRFNEPVILSGSLADFSLGGTSGISGQPVSVKSLSESMVELKIIDLTSVFIASNTVTVTVSNVTDLAGNTINEQANTATYVMDDSLPEFSISEASSILHRSAVITASIDKPGELFWSVFSNETSTVAVDEILGETGEVNGTETIGFGQSQTDIIVDQLVWNTTYKFFCVAISREGALSDIVSTSFTTKGPEEPFDQDELGEYKTYSVQLKNGRIVVELKERQLDNAKRRVSLYDINGRLFYSGSMAGSELVLPKTVAGVYLVLIENGEESEVHKVFVTD